MKTTLNLFFVLILSFFAFSHVTAQTVITAKNLFQLKVGDKICDEKASYGILDTFTVTEIYSDAVYAQKTNGHGLELRPISFSKTRCNGYEMSAHQGGTIYHIHYSGESCEDQMLASHDGEELEPIDVFINPYNWGGLYVKL